MNAMKNKTSIALVSASTLLVFCFAGALNVPAADDAASPARSVIGTVIQNALAILRDSKLSVDVKREKVNQIAIENVNFDVMARLSLGRYYRDLTDAQRTQYSEAFKTHV